MVPIMLFIALVFLIFVFIFLIFEMIKEKKRKSRCTERVLAEVVGYTDVRFYDNENHSYYNKKAPLYEYSCNGELCRLAGSTDSKWVKKVEIGSYIEIFVDPDNPKSFFCPEEDKTEKRHNVKMVCLFFGIILALFLGIMLISAYCKNIEGFYN